MLKGIEIHNFRGIREGSINGFRQVTIFIGKNGSGKSTILEAIYLASACVEPYDIINKDFKANYIIMRRGGRGDWRSSGDILWYQMDSSKPLKINLYINNESYSFHVFRKPHSNDIENVIGLVYGDFYANIRGAWKRGATISPIPDILRNKLRDLEMFLKPVVLVDGRLLLNPKEIENTTWTSVSAKRLDKKIVEMIREELEREAEGLTYLPFGNTYTLALQTLKTTIRIDDLGAGAKDAILISLIILGLKPKILLLEEPESHMYPLGLYTFTKFLIRLAGEYGFQVIVSTHSNDFINIVRKVSQEIGVESRIIYIERSLDGVINYRDFSPDNVEILGKLGIDVRMSHVF